MTGSRLARLALSLASAGTGLVSVAAARPFAGFPFFYFGFFTGAHLRA